MTRQTSDFARRVARVALLLICSTYFFPRALAQSYLYGRGNFAAGTQGQVAIADFNGDGYPDAAVTDQQKNSVDILLGAASEGFVAGGSYPTGSVPTNLIAGDFNGDKKPDVAVLNANSGTISILLGNGDGTFQSRTDYPVGENPVGLVAADFNGDGKLDLATISTGDSAVAILTGDGHGGFEVGGLISVLSAPTMLAAGDLNGDGKPDLITLNSNFSNSQFIALVNQGNGTFTQVPSQGPEDATAMAAGDFNGDGKLDVVTISFSNLYLSAGNGDGSFGAASSIPNGPPNINGNVPVIVVGDFNRDHKADLAVPGLWVMLGKGDGTFQNPLGSPMNATPMAAVDINGDGIADMVGFSGYFQNPGAMTVLLGDGNGTFMNSRNAVLASTAYGTGAGVAADFNGDGKLDLAVLEANYPNAQVSVELGKGRAKFGQPIVSALSSTAGTTVLLAADFNGDKKQDLLAIDNNGQGFQVVLGQGQGSFGTAVDTSLAFQVISLATGDFNKDGRADVVVTSGYNNSPLIAVFLSNGDGTFTAGPEYVIYPNSTVAVGDVNGDGNPDLVVTSANNDLLVFLGQGDGTFSQPVFGPSAGYSSYAAIADFNGDGKVDIAIGASNYPTQSMAFLAGNGDGTFESPVYSDPGWNFYGPLLAADFSGNGQLGLASGPQGCCTSYAFIMSGNGDGTFGTPLGLDSSNSFNGSETFVVGDFNGDGTADVGLGAEFAQNSPVILLDLSTPATVFAPSALGFGKIAVGKTSPPKKITLTNAGNSKLKISGITTSGDFLEKNNCGKSLGVGQSCTIQVSFKPKTKGKREGTLSIADNAPASPQRISLTGTGK